MLPKGVNQRAIVEKRLKLLHNRQHWFHDFIGKPYKAHYALARNAVRANFKQFTVRYEEELIQLYALQFMKPSKVGVVEVMIQTITGLNFHAL